MKKPLVSIIIPVIKINEYIRQSIPEILKIKGDYEIVIVTDKPEKSIWPKTKTIASGKWGPAKKRDIGAKEAKGEILAFLDDDAYPEKDWLKNALPHFKNKKIAALGGPAITPKTDTILQKAFGSVAESYLGGGGAPIRFLSLGKAKFVNDWPTVNLLVRKSVFNQIGGFNSHYWPGEDTKMCLDIINKGYLIIYEPKSVVYHHRRSDLLRYLKQIGNYGLHRGFFVKKFPQTSFKLWYFAPSFLTLYLILLPPATHIFPNLGNIFILPLIIYLAGLLINGFITAYRWKNIVIGILSIPLIVLTHIWYGIRFIQGLIIDKLER